jgi:hypothetical protein
MLAEIREGSFFIVQAKWWVVLALIVAAVFLVAPVLVDAKHWFPRRRQ